MAGFNTWNPKTRGRADREHARKKRTRWQKRHLLCLKGKEGVRRILLAGRRRQKGT